MPNINSIGDNGGSSASPRRHRRKQGTPADDSGGRGRLRAALPSAPEAWLAYASVALIYVSHLLFAGMRMEVALWLSLCIAGLLAAALARPALRDQLRWRPIALLSIPFGAVLLLAALSLGTWGILEPHPIWRYLGFPEAVAIDRSAALVEIVRLLALGSIFLIGALTGASDRRASATLQLLVLAGAVFALWAFIGATAGLIPQTQGRRLEAHFLSPNTAGSVFGAMSLLAIGVAARRWRAAAPRERVYTAATWGLPVLLLASTMLATLSRGALLGTLAGLLLYGALTALQSPRGGSHRNLILAALGAVLIVLVSGHQTLERLLRAGADAELRAQTWRTHWEAVSAAPWLGNGLGSFDAVNRSLLTAENFASLWNMRAAHNVYLQWVEEAGGLGAAAMFITVAIVLASALVGALRRREVKELLFGLLAFDAVLLFHAATDFALHTFSVCILFAFVLGLQFSLSQRRGDPRAGATQSSRVVGLSIGWASAGLTAALAGATLAALLGGGALRLGGLTLLEHSGGYQRRVDKLLAQKENRGESLAEAAALTGLALRQSPFDTGGWMRQAYIEELRHGRMTPAAVKAIQRSYGVVGVDPNISLWRIRFCLEHWPDLPVETRQDVAREASAIRTAYDHSLQLERMLKQINDPSGRLAADVLYRRLYQPAPPNDPTH